MQNSYYSNINQDLLKAIPGEASFVLEIGCGTGQFAKAYRSLNPATCYVGVEIFESAAREAERNVSYLITGDIANPVTLSAIDKVRSGRFFDVLVLGDVIEHLGNPGEVLEELITRMRPGGMCVACIPNVSHWSIVLQLLHGRWDYTETGLLDRTHLRFFTLDTAVDLFKQAGWSVLDARPRILMKEKTDSVAGELLPLSKNLGISPEKMYRDLSAFQWVIRALNLTEETTSGI
jgi:SAM-dependent methyltransferase